MTDLPNRFPKVRAVYERDNNENDRYTVNPVVNQGFDWVFEDAENVEAVEKIHGTNMSVLRKNGRVTDVATRIGDRSMNRVNPYSDTESHYLVRGVQNSIRRGYINESEDGWLFGELVGPKVHGNPYKLDEHLFVPFDWLRDKCQYKSYGKYSTEFEDISNWLQNEIFSLFYSKMNGTELSEASVSNGVFVEGIVFIHPDFNHSIHPRLLETSQSDDYGSVTRTIGKLRRDMFDWYEE